MKNKRWLFFAALVLVLSCKKDVTELPAPSQNGSNIFGCNINGVLWVPAGFGIVPTAPILEARGGLHGFIFINARNFSATPTEKEFELYLKDFNGPGVYLLNEATAKYPSQTASYGYYVRRKYTPENEWITNTQYTGRIDVTAYDSVNRFISGTFSFNAINIYNDPQTLEVTDGRFDVKLQ